MVVCVTSELVYTVTAFYDAGSTWVDLVRTKRKEEKKRKLGFANMN